MSIIDRDFLSFQQLEVVIEYHPTTWFLPGVGRVGEFLPGVGRVGDTGVVDSACGFEDASCGLVGADCVAIAIDDTAVEGFVRVARVAVVRGE
jgi:hypothetical protein